MALKGFISADTYGIVNNISYSKMNKSVHFEFTVYTDNTKETQVTNTYFNVPMNEFDTFFDITAMSVEGSNILSAAYTYLKSKPGFSTLESI